MAKDFSFESKLDKILVAMGEAGNLEVFPHPLLKKDYSLKTEIRLNMGGRIKAQKIALKVQGEKDDPINSAIQRAKLFSLFRQLKCDEIDKELLFSKDRFSEKQLLKVRRVEALREVEIRVTEREARFQISLCSDVEVQIQISLEEMTEGMEMEVDLENDFIMSPSAFKLYLDQIICTSEATSIAADLVSIFVKKAIENILELFYVKNSWFMYNLEGSPKSHMLGQLYRKIERPKGIEKIKILSISCENFKLLVQIPL